MTGQTGRIHIFGDSHARFNFSHLQKEHTNHAKDATTMHRIGRDGLDFIDFKSRGIQENDVVIYQVGEVDCRCHIARQLNLGRDLVEIVTTLTHSFIDSVVKNSAQYQDLGIVICCVPPPMSQEYYENLHGPITHEFPFIGTDQDRAYYTRFVNEELKKLCEEHNFFFLDYYNYYTNQEGLLNPAISDNLVHIVDTTHIRLILSDYLRAYSGSL